MECFSILSLTTKTCCDQFFLYLFFHLKSLWCSLITKTGRTLTASFRQFRCTFLQFLNSIFSQVKKDPKTVLTRMQINAKVKIPLSAKLYLCSVYQLAEGRDLKVPFWYSPAKGEQNQISKLTVRVSAGHI